MNIQKILLGALGVVILYNLFFFQVGPGIGTGLFFLLIHGFLFYTRSKNAHVVPAVTSSSISILFGFFEGFRANGEVQLVNLLVSLGATIAAVYYYRISWKDRVSLVHMAATPFRVFGRSIVALYSLIFSREDNHNRTISSFGAILRGILITLPIFLILLLLLTHADAAFGNLTEKLLSQSIERIILSTFIFGVLVSWGLSTYKQIVLTIKSPVGHGKHYELGILAGSIVVLFTAFIFVQFRYLFSQVGERELGELGVKSLTYSEYVRKGFFELLTAGAVAGGVISFIMHFLHRLAEKPRMILQGLTTILTIETGLLLYSAFTRLVLYSDAHGLTRIRVWGFFFLLWLFGILVMLFIRAVRELSQEKIAYGVLGITMFVFVVMNLYNTDQVIATKYIPTVNDEIDYSYITLLSPDAYESWNSAMQYIEKEINEIDKTAEFTSDHYRRLALAETTLWRIKYNIDELLIKYGTYDQLMRFSGDRLVRSNDPEPDAAVRKAVRSQTWLEYNQSEAVAYKHVNNNFEFYLRISELRSKIIDLQKHMYDQQLNNTIPLDRPVNHPVVR